MAINVGTLEALLVLRDQLSPALAAVERTIKGAGGTMDGWTEAEQRAAMAMAGAHSEALRLNAAMEASARASAAAAAGASKWSDSQQAAAMQMSSLHAEALKMNEVFDNDRGLAGKLTKTGEKLQAVGGGMQSAGMMMLPITGVIAGIGGASIAAAGQFQQTKIAFETMLGSAEKADKFLKDMRAFAAQTPFEFNDVTSAAKRLMALGFSAEQVLPTLRTVGDAVAGLGGGAPMIDRVTLALGQMQAKGKVSAQEMNQLAEAGIPAWDMLAKTIGVSIPEAMAMGEKGALKSAEAIPAILAGMQAKFGGLMEKQSKTVLGQWSNTMDKLAEMAVKVGDAMLPAVDAIVGTLNSALPYIVKLIDAFTALPQPIQLTVIGILAAVAALGPLLMMLGSLISTVGVVMTAVGGAGPVFAALGTAATTATGAITAAAAAMGVTVGAFLGSIAAIAAVGYAFYNLTDYLIDNTKWGQKVVETLSDVILKMQDVNLKALEAGQGVSQAAKDYAKWWGEQHKGQTKANEDTKKETALTAASIKAALAKKAADELCAKATKELGKEVKDVTLARQVLAQADAMSEAGQKKAAAAMEKQREATKKYAIELDHARIAAEKLGNTMGFVIPPLPPPSEPLKQNIDQIADGAWRATDAIVAQGIQLAKNGAGGEKWAEKFKEKLAATGLTASQIEEVMGRIGVEVEKLPRETDKFGSTLRNVTQAVVMLGQMFGGTFEQAAEALSTLDDGWKNYKEAMAEAETAQDRFLAKIGFAAEAANVLGGVLASTKSKTGQLAGAALQGAAAGAKMGASFGPLGAGIGAVAGGIMGFINKSKQMRAEVKSLYDNFVQFHGGMDKLKDRAQQAGVSLEDVFKNKGTKNVAAMEKAVEEAGQKIGIFEDMLKDLSMGSMAELRVAAAQARVSLDAMLNAKTVAEYEQAVKSVQEQMQTWLDATNGVREAMERYGITIEQMGPKWAQQELDKKAAQLLQDYKLLTAAGADVNLVIEKMGPAFSEYVQSVIASGTTIPEALRPAVEKLIQNRQLLDANGEAYESVEEAGVQFAKTQSEMFDSLIEKIDKLVNALLGIPNEVNTTVNVRRNYEGGNEPPEEYYGGGEYGGPVYAAAGFSGWVNRPTTFVAGERGPEHVRIEPRAAADSGGEQTVIIPVSIGGEELTRLILNRTRTGHIRVDTAGMRVRG